MTMTPPPVSKRLALLCIALVALASTGSLADEVKPLATTLDHVDVKDGEAKFIEMKDMTPDQLDVVYKAPKHLQNMDVEDRPVEDIDVKEKAAVLQGMENEGRTDETIEVKDKPPSHLENGDRPGGFVGGGRVNANDSKPPSHLEDGDKPGGVDNTAPNGPEVASAFIYPGDSVVGEQSEESVPVLEETAGPISVEDPAALIRGDGEDFRPVPTKDESEFVDSENGAAFIGAEYDGENNIAGRSQSRTMNVPKPDNELETTLIYGDKDSNIQGRFGVVQAAFYPAVMIGEENEDEKREEEANAITNEEDEEGRIGTRALEKKKLAYIDASPPKRKHKRMLRTSVAARVNVMRSSRGVEIRDKIVDKASERPSHNKAEKGERELYQVSQVCRNKVENDGWVGDGWCDTSGGYNIAACGWDGGDCCKPTCVSLGVEGYDCTSETDCKDPAQVGAPAPFDYTKCYKSVQTDAWVGDGYCDRTGGYNNAECNYDGGDCCESTCKSGSGGNCETKFYCENPNAQGESVSPPPPTPNPTKNPTPNPTKSPTKAPVPSRTTNDNNNGKPDYNVVSNACKNKVDNWQWVGDGWCDPDSNYNSAACGYDGGDCCKKTCTDGEYSCGSASGVGFNRCEDPWVKNAGGPAPTPANSPPTPANNNNSSPDGFNQNLSGEDKVWTDFHNVRRKRYQEQYGYSYVPLMWSNTMAQSSQSYANKLAQGRCEDYDHDPNNPWGENLAVIWGNHNIERVMKAWVENEELAPNAPYKSGHGHMTQALWRATKYLGCAWSQNSECKIYVCRYIKPGNCNRGTNTWLADTMDVDSPCGPDCPPNEGCFHPHDA